jgi:hypothetical protein
MPERLPLSRNYRANPLTRLNLLWALIFKPWNMPITSSTCGILEVKRRFEPIGEITLNGPMGWCGSWTVRIGRGWICVDKNWCVSCDYFRYVIRILVVFPASYLFDLTCLDAFDNRNACCNKSDSRERVCWSLPTNKTWRGAWWPQKFQKCWNCTINNMKIGTGRFNPVVP